MRSETKEKLGVFVFVIWLMTMVGGSYFVLWHFTRPHVDSFGSNLNMQNTVFPILETVAENACNYKNVTISINGDNPWSDGGTIIYKREPTSEFKENPSCAGRIKNEYYARCYQWKWQGDRLYYHVQKDVDLDSFSCIDESQLEMVYPDKDLQNAKVGESFYVQTHQV